jgi:hypothetical protein
MLVQCWFTLTTAQSLKLRAVINMIMTGELFKRRLMHDT